MGSHSTNYFDTFITIAPDSNAAEGIAPPTRANPTVAERTFAMIAEAPYRYTSDDVIFTVWADGQEILAAEREAAREQFFSKGQPCLRSSDLGKKYGWGTHHDSQGRVAVYPVESAEYRALTEGVAPDGKPVTVKSAMRSKR